MDEYLVLLTELEDQGNKFDRNAATFPHSTYPSAYLGGPTPEWQVWQARVVAALSRRFKEGSPPFALVQHAMRFEFNDNRHEVFDEKRRGLVTAIQTARALLRDQQKLGEGISVDSKSNRKPTIPAGSAAHNVFIVHGHDGVMKDNVARTVEKLGLAPIILHEKPNQGRTIIEKIHDYSDVGFAIVLLSPDDVGYSRTGGEPRSRARQNVILELGFFLGLLGRARVLALFKEDANFEMPSDYSGVLFKPFDAGGSWKLELCKELQAIGIKVDANRILT